MIWLKVATDLVTAGWLIWLSAVMTTDGSRSTIIFRAVPILLAFLLAMSHAKVFF